MGESRGRLGWYARRLSTMRPDEVAWRVGRLARTSAARATEGHTPRGLPTADADWERWLDAFRRAESRPILLDRARADRLAQQRPAQVVEVVAAAEAWCEGRVRFFGYPEVRLSRPPDWHHDPVSGYDWPTTAADRIDHRTAPADAKWIWELNRLQHLPLLAQAWLFTGREEFAETAFEHLDSWLDQSPGGRGIAWRGAFEVGLRSISVLVALQGLRDSPLLTVARFRRLVTMLEASGRMCWRERSLFSSANNHLVGELAGLATIGALLPELPRADRWVRRAQTVLAEHADRQILPDGMGAEQAFGYQLFAVELILVALVLAPSRGGPPTRALEDAVRRSSAFLATVVTPGEPALRYGDDDGGFALRLGPEEVRTVPDHLELVRAVGRRETGGSLAAAWISLATEGARPVAAEQPATPSSTYAEDGGLVVLRSGGQRLTVDVGPLGYLALAAHGHADALAVTLSRDGASLVDDPGTASYYGHPEWRVVQRGTRAHATVTVDGQDQSVIAGPFLWSHHAQVRVHEVDLQHGVVDAEHDGYARLESPVTHRRRVQAAPADGGCVVVDVLTGAHRHQARVSWPLAPDLAAVTTEDGHLVSRAGEPVLRIVSAATVPLVHEAVVGDASTQLGWWSDRLESRRPAYLLSSVGEGTLPLVVASVLRPVGEGAGTVTDLTVSVEGGLVHVSWREGGASASTTLRIGQW